MKRFTFLKLFFTALFAVVFATMNADESSTFTDKNLAVGEGELGWTASVEAQQIDNQFNRGVQFGTNGSPVASFTLTSGQSLTQVTSVAITASAKNAGSTISVTVGGVEFTGDVTEIAKGTNNANQVYTFTGAATDGDIVITISNNTASVYVKSITVACTSTPSIEVAAPEFSVPAGMYSKPFDLTLSAPEANRIMYTLDGTEPSVDEGNGKIYENPIHISETTTVKAIALDADANTSRVVSATYTILNVEASTYQAVTSSAELVDGGTYIIVADSKEVSVALSEADNDKRTAVPVTIEENQIVTPANISQLPYEVTLQHVSGNQYRLYDATSGGFIAMKGDNTDLTISNNENDESAWEITVSDNETAFVNAAQTKRGILYRISQDVFGAYANSNKSNKDYSTVRLYKKVEAATTGTFSIGAPGYSTYFTDKAFVMPEGVEGGIVTDAANGRLTVKYCYHSGTTVPANTGLLLKGAAKTYTYDLSTETPDAPEVNFLKGSVEAARTEGEGCLFYMLSYDKEGKNLGFYWGEEEGAAFKNGAGKAYLALPQTVASQVRGFVLDGTTTGISGVTTEANNAPAAVYSLTGVRMGTSTDGLPAGIYIVNGKKVLVK